MLHFLRLEFFGETKFKMSLQCSVIVALLAIGLACASSTNDIPSEQKASAKLKCESSYNLMCLKLDILSLIDRLSTSNKEFNLASGIVLVRENNPNKTQNTKIVSGKLASGQICD